MSRSRNVYIIDRSPCCIHGSVLQRLCINIAQYVTSVGLSFERIFIKVKSCLTEKAASARGNIDININSELAYGKLRARG